MLSAIASFVWTSGPIMSAVFTILFLILIRMWSRSTPSYASVTKPITKIGEKVGEAGKEIKETAGDLADVVEGLECIDEVPKVIENSTSQLDILFFGELFVASIASGFLVKYGW